MNKKTINQLLALNKHFYKQVADDFSQTRQKPWQGWYQIAKIIKSYFNKKKNISVLDLGCGNGRFYGFLKEIADSSTFPSFPKLRYLGVDQNQQLLKEAQQKYGAHLFKKLDIINSLNKLKKTYHLVVAFGVTHHIPSSRLRAEWFSQLPRLIKTPGMLIFNIWNFNKTSAFSKAKRSIKTGVFNIQSNQLQAGDYFLGWRDKNVYRYCHLYSASEIKKIINLLKKKNLNLYQEFTDNGKENVAIQLLPAESQSRTGSKGLPSPGAKRIRKVLEGTEYLQENNLNHYFIYVRP